MAIEGLKGDQFEGKGLTDLQGEKAENQPEISDSIVSSMHFMVAKILKIIL